MKRIRAAAFMTGVLILGLMLTGCAQILRARGEIAMASNNYEAAIGHFQESLIKNPDDHETRARLGFAHFKAGRTDQAIEILREVLLKKADEPSASLYLGMALLKRGERGAAMAAWRNYRNPAQPIVNKEIKKQLTLLEMVESRELAKKALADEEKLQAVAVKPGTIGVTPFQDLSPDGGLRPMQKGMTAMITTDLSNVKALQVVERLRLQALIDEMKLGLSGIVDNKTAPRFGRLAGAENLVAGNLGSAEPMLRVNTSIASSVKKDVVDSFGVEAEKQKFFELEKEIVFNIGKILNVPLTPEEKEALGWIHTKNLQAFLYYGQGLDALDGGEWKTARAFFEKAVKEDPAFDLAIQANDSCPGDEAPTPASLMAMNPAQVAAQAESAVSASQVSQSSADAAAAAAAAAAAGGGDGGGG